MRDLNYFNFSGRVGFIEEKEKYTTVVVYVHDDYKDKNTDDWVNKSYPLRTIFFGSTKEYIGRNIEVGNIVIVTGSIDTYKNKEDHNILSLKGNSIQKTMYEASGNKQDDSSTKRKKKSSQKVEDEVPFEVDDDDFFDI